MLLGRVPVRYFRRHLHTACLSDILLVLSGILPSLPYPHIWTPTQSMHHSPVYRTLPSWPHIQEGWMWLVATLLRPHVRPQAPNLEHKACWGCSVSTPNAAGQWRRANQCRAQSGQHQTRYVWPYVWPCMCPECGPAHGSSSPYILLPSSSSSSPNSSSQNSSSSYLAGGLHG